MVRQLQEVVGRKPKRGGMEGTLKRWTSRAVVVVLAVGGWTAVTGVSSAAAAESPAQAEAAFVSRINSERSAAGRSPLAARGDLASVARSHAQRMVNRNDLFHNPNLGGEVSGWEVVSENVGTGPNVSEVHRALMGSSTHRSNILSHEVTEVGVGVVGTPDGSLWVVQVFRRPMGAVQPAPAPVAAPDPAPAPAPAPAPRAVAPNPAPRPVATPPTTTVPPAPTTTVPPASPTTVPDAVADRRVAAAAFSEWALVGASSRIEPVPTSAAPMRSLTLTLWLAALVTASGAIGVVGARRLAHV